MPDKIAVLGFSAGGHLAAMVSNMPGSVEARPDASILCYPVLSSLAARAHLGSYYNLFGNQLAPQEYYDFCWPEVANHDTPLAFLWHTVTDDAVPVENSIEYTMALKKLNIPVELHLFPKGCHGLGLGERPNVAAVEEIKIWPQLAAKFLKNLGW
jgi:acetyl esterase/lipase